MWKRFVIYKYQWINVLSHVTLIFMTWVFGWQYLLVGLFMGWLWSNVFHYLYLHRILTHQHFHVSRRLHLVGLACSSILNLGSPAVYPAVHMKHHANSGNESDPHDPYHRGWLRIMTSLWDNNFRPQRKTFLRMLKNPDVRWFHNYHTKFCLLGALVVPFLPVVAFWMSKIVIGLVHIPRLGYGTHYKDDNSTNIPWLKPLTWGEELHNNHHVKPSAADHNLKQRWYEFDVLYYIGRKLEWIFPETA